MFFDTALLASLIGLTTAFTPAGFVPASTNNLTVAFSNALAMNGVVIPKADSATAPRIGASIHLDGSYTVMMVDLDVPNSSDGTSQLLHWMQGELVSANTSTIVFGQEVFMLQSPSTIVPFATYLQPSPPNKIPISHRYVQVLLNTTGNNASLSLLKAAAATRRDFNASNVLSMANLTPVMGNSFNVSNWTSTNDSVDGVQTSAPLGSTGHAGRVEGARVLVGGIGVLAAIAAML